MTRSPSQSGGLGGRSDSYSRRDSRQEFNLTRTNSNNFTDWMDSLSNISKNFGTDLSRISSRVNTAISSSEMEMCGATTALGLSTLAGGSVETTCLLAAGAPSGGLSLIGTPATLSVATVGLVTTFGGLGCMTGLIVNAAMGGGEPKKPSNNECAYYEPQNLQDQMVMNAVKKGHFDFDLKLPGVRVDKIPIKLNDQRFVGMQKMQISVQSAKGLKTNIHYNEDKSGNKYDFKFKGACQ